VNRFSKQLIKNQIIAFMKNIVVVCLGLVTALSVAHVYSSAPDAQADKAKCCCILKDGKKFETTADNCKAKQGTVAPVASCKK